MTDWGIGLLLIRSNKNVVTNVATNVVTNEEKILALLKQDSKLTSKQLALSVGITQRQVQRVISNLKESGLIVRHGATKNGYWEVVEKDK